MLVSCYTRDGEKDLTGRHAGREAQNALCDFSKLNAQASGFSAELEQCDCVQYDSFDTSGPSRFGGCGANTNGGTKSEARRGSAVMDLIKASKARNCSIEEG